MIFSTDRQAAGKNRPIDLRKVFLFNKEVRTSLRTSYVHSIILNAGNVVKSNLSRR